jgi:hypothetical protein
MILQEHRRRMSLNVKDPEAQRLAQAIAEVILAAIFFD